MQAYGPPTGAPRPVLLNPQGGSVWIGTGTTTPKGTLHVRNGASGVDPHEDADELVVESDGDEVGVSVLGPNAKTAALIFGTPSNKLGAWVRWEHGGKLMRIGTASPDGEVRIDSASSWEAIRIAKSRRVGIGTTSPSALLDVDQKETDGAMPVLRLDQADVSAEFVRFVGTAAASNITQSIVAEPAVGTFTTKGYLKIHVQDDGSQVTEDDYYVPFGTLQPPPP